MKEHVQNLNKEGLTLTGKQSPLNMCRVISEGLLTSEKVFNL